MSIVKSITRLIVAGTLLAGFYLAPAMFDPRPPDPIDVAVDRVDRITIRMATDDERRIVKTSDGSWSFEDGNGEPDGTLVENFLLNLDGGEFKSAVPGPSSSAAVSVTIRDDFGASVDVVPGRRLKPFAGQRVNVNGRSFEVDRDLSACLNQWVRSRPMGAAAFSEPHVYDLDPESVSFVAHDDLCCEYRYEKSGGSWRLSKPAGDYRLDQAAMAKFVDGLAWLSGIPTSADSLPRNSRGWWRDRVRFVADGELVEFKVGSPFGELHRRSAVEVIEPERALLTVGATDRHRLLPRPSTLIRDLPEIRVDPETIVAVSTRRLGARDYALTKKDGAWSFVKPSVSAPIAMVESELGTEILNRAELLALNLGRVRSLGLFDPSAPGRRRLLNTTLAKPAAIVKVRTINGRTLTYKISRSPEKSRIRLISTGNKVLVTSDAILDRIAPELKTFFAPDALEGKLL